MAIFSAPRSFRLNNDNGDNGIISLRAFGDGAFGALQQPSVMGHDSHPPLGHLILLVFEAVMEVVCVSLPGYIIARQGLFDADKQKFLANLNVMLFTPCLIFTKLASQLTAEKLTDLAVIPAIFIVQMLVSYLVSIGVSKAFGFAKRPANFVTAMGVFGNSNSLPISLVISLSQTLKGLHWDQIPGDNDEEVAARGILYLLIFQQLGQLVRWSWGYHVLLAPAEEREDPNAEAIEEGRYRDNMGNDQPIAGLDGPPDFHTAIYQPPAGLHESRSSASFDSGGRTPVDGQYIEGIDVEDIDDNSLDSAKKPLLSSQYGGDTVGHQEEPEDNLTFFPSIRTTMARKRDNLPSGVRGWPKLVWVYIGYEMQVFTTKTQKASSSLFKKLPLRLQTALKASGAVTRRFFHGLWEFMNPPLWAMLFAVIIASVPSLQRLFFEEGSFIANSATRAVAQSGGVAVPLILVVLGANLARNTLPKAALDADSEENKIGTKLLIASLISRMLLPTLIMAPILALVAKYVPVSIVDDPIFVIVCFLLTGAPSALQLAQICQINGVYEGVMSKILFQSYVIWILPSTLVLVMCALEVVEWANPISAGVKAIVAP